MAETKEARSAEAAVEAEEAGLLEQIMQETKMRPSDEGYDVAKKGVDAFIAEMLAPKRTEQKANKDVVDQMIAEIDRKLSVQVDEILHHRNLQKWESAWRGLKYTFDNINFRDNIKIEMVNVSKDDLLEYFEDAPEVVKSGLYKHAYVAEYSQFGGEPIGAMIANYGFGPGAQDIKLLQSCASVATMAHAPFIAAAGPKFFGVDSIEELPKLKDLKSIFEGPQYAK